MAGQAPFATIGAQDDKIVLPESFHTDAHPREASPAEVPLAKMRVADDIGYPFEPDADFSGATREERNWALPVLGTLALTLWTAVFGWAHADLMMRGLSAAIAVDLAAIWSGPALLIVVAWAFLARSSRASSARYLSTAQTLRHETQALEARLAAMNRELSLAREFLSGQARDLDTLGRIATERLTQHAQALAGMIGQNTQQVDALGTVSAAALENMTRMREQAPVIITSTRDIANMIGNAGRVAQSHLSDMVTGLTKVNEYGLANERQVTALREQMQAFIAAMESQLRQFDSLAATRLQGLEARSAAFDEALATHERETMAALTTRMETFNAERTATSTQLDSAEAESLVSLRARFAALRDEAGNLTRHLHDSGAGAEAEWQGVLARMNAQLVALDGEIGQRHAAQITQGAKLGAIADVTTARLAALHAQIETIARTDVALGQELAERLDRLEMALPATSQTVDKLTDDAVRLLELIEASAHHARTALPEALAVSDQQLANHAASIHALRDGVNGATDQAQVLADFVAATQGTLGDIRDTAFTMHDGLDARAAAHARALSEIMTATQALDGDLSRISDRARGELTVALEALTNAVTVSVGRIDETAATHVHALAGRLGSESAAAIEAALSEATAGIGARLEQSAYLAAGVSRNAASEIADRLAEADASVAHLEARVAEARAGAEERLDNDFARRAATITDALNSAAIDITTALASDVADTSWAAYLRGDRGIFTRRSVRLLDNGDAKSVLALYEGEPVFADAVNRYIHDFEGLLRQLLATRDGHALSVTLLSSDKGKLYVALAQAIERLRT